MKNIIAKPVRMVILVLSLSLLGSVVLRSAAPADDPVRNSTGESRRIRGTGNYSQSSVVRTEERLNPPFPWLAERRI